MEGVCSQCSCETYNIYCSLSCACDPSLCQNRSLDQAIEERHNPTVGRLSTCTVNLYQHSSSSTEETPNLSAISSEEAAALRLQQFWEELALLEEVNIIDEPRPSSWSNTSGEGVDMQNPPFYMQAYIASGAFPQPQTTSPVLQSGANQQFPQRGISWQNPNVQAAVNYQNSRPRAYYTALLQQQQQQLCAQVPFAAMNQLNCPQFQAAVLQSHQPQGLLQPLNTSKELRNSG